jgi:hypothetical protein
MSARDDEKVGARGRGGVPLAVWAVAAFLWVVTVGFVAITGDDPVLLPRAALYAVACVGAGALIALIVVALRRGCALAVTCVLIMASGFGREYLAWTGPVTGVEAAVVIAGSVIVYVASKTTAGRLPLPEIPTVAEPAL